METFRHYEATAIVPDGKISGWFAESAGALLPVSPLIGGSMLDSWTVADDILSAQVTISTFGEPNARRILPIKFDPIEKLSRLYRAIAGFKCGMPAYALERFHHFKYAGALEIMTIRDGFSVEERMNFFMETYLGSWDSQSLSGLLNLCAVAGIDSESTTEELHRFIRSWYGRTNGFFTRLAGFQYQSKQFLRRENGVEKSRLSKGDECRLIREPHNHVDPNAIMVVHQSGRKMGYLRRTIAQYLAPVMDQGALFTGTITGFLPLEIPLNERVHIGMSRVG